jgi:hypothetical protein
MPALVMLAFVISAPMTPLVADAVGFNISIDAI